MSSQLNFKTNVCEVSDKYFDYTNNQKKIFEKNTMQVLKTTAKSMKIRKQNMLIINLVI